MPQPLIFTPTAFDEMGAIAEAFASGSTVVVNLLAADETEKRRIIDFASGAVLAARGQMEMVQPGFMVMKPPRPSGREADLRAARLRLGRSLL